MPRTQVSLEDLLNKITTDIPTSLYVSGICLLGAWGSNLASNEYIDISQNEFKDN